MKLQHDQKEEKIFFTAAVICTVTDMLFFLLSSRESFDTLFLLISLAAIFLCGCSMILWFMYLDCLSYLKRLKLHGYEIPYDKRKFYSELENLPHIQPEASMLLQPSKESTALSLTSLICSIGILIREIIYLHTYDYTFTRASAQCEAHSHMVCSHGYDFMYDTTFRVFCLMLPLVLFWLIASFVFWRQRNRQKYRDDVEPDDGRKRRKQISTGIAEIIICLLFTLLIIEVLNTFTGFVYHHRISDFT